MLLLHCDQRHAIPAVSTAIASHQRDLIRLALRAIHLLHYRGEGTQNHNLSLLHCKWRRWIALWRETDEVPSATTRDHPALSQREKIKK